MTVELGGRYRDGATGFEGTAIARAVYLAGYTAVLVVRADATGKPEEVWIPENRLTVTAPNVATVDSAQAKPGVGFR